MSGFDLDAQAAQADQEDSGCPVHVEDIKGTPLYYKVGDEEKAVTIRVAGAHSKTYRQAEAKLRKRKLKPNQFTKQALHDDAMALAVMCTLSWEGMNGPGGVALPFTAENVRKVYTLCPWVYDLVNEAMHDHTNFFSNSSQEPSNT
jgi:hypothetical protein